MYTSSDMPWLLSMKRHFNGRLRFLFFLKTFDSIRVFLLYLFFFFFFSSLSIRSFFLQIFSLPLLLSFSFLSFLFFLLLSSLTPHIFSSSLHSFFSSLLSSSFSTDSPLIDFPFFSHLSSFIPSRLFSPRRSFLSSSTLLSQRFLFFFFLLLHSSFSSPSVSSFLSYPTLSSSPPPLDPFLSLSLKPPRTSSYRPSLSFIPFSISPSLEPGEERSISSLSFFPLFLHPLSSSPLSLRSLKTTPREILPFSSSFSKCGDKMEALRRKVPLSSLKKFLPFPGRRKALDHHREDFLKTSPACEMLKSRRMRCTYTSPSKEDSIPSSFFTSSSSTSSASLTNLHSSSSQSSLSFLAKRKGCLSSGRYSSRTSFSSLFTNQSQEDLRRSILSSSSSLLFSSSSSSSLQNVRFLSSSSSSLFSSPFTPVFPASRTSPSSSSCLPFHHNSRTHSVSFLSSSSLLTSPFRGGERGERTVLLGGEQQGIEEEAKVTSSGVMTPGGGVGGDILGGGEQGGEQHTHPHHHLHHTASSPSASPCTSSSSPFLPPLYENPPPSVGSIFNSVVKVYSDFTDPNYSLPWQMQRQGTSTGSGFVLKNRLIMTNAHCVSWNNRLQVRKHGSPHKYVARIVSVAHECDLALITVDDEAFWQGDLAGLEFGDVPALQDAVVVLGYPRGGDNLCITSGVVSRVDVNPYAHSNTCLLCVQIDAAINPGNSGGPALKDGLVVGVAFQGFDNAQNIGYIVPTSVIKHFLDDVALHKNRYTGFPTAGIIFQHLENKSMQTYLGMDQIKKEDLPPGVEASGILVTLADQLRAKQYLRMVEGEEEKKKKKEEDLKKEKEKETSVNEISSQCQSPEMTDENVGEKEEGGEKKEGEKKIRKDQESQQEKEKEEEEDVRLKDGTLVGLKKNDVILAVDGVDVANDGTVFFREMERVNVSHAISSKFIGDTLQATILRKKKILNVLIPLIEENALVPKHQWDKKARYLIYGGLVFCPLTLEYLKDEFGTKFHERAPSSLLQPLADIFAKEEGEEPIILSHILASDLTSGYTFRNCMLTHVNGEKVLNMKHLARLLNMLPPSSSPSFSSEGEETSEEGEKKKRKTDESVREDDFIIFLLENKVQLVLERSKAEAMQPYILKQHAIHSPTSEIL